MSSNESSKALLSPHVESAETIASLVSKLSELLDAEKKKMDQAMEISENDPITFNVGGQMFATTMQTLNKVPGSYFGVLISGRWDLQRSAHYGVIFIDRDPDVFGYLLKYLRDPDDFHNVYPHLSAVEKHQLRKDCEFFMLPELFVSVVPLPSASFSELRSLIGFKSLRLLYQWSEDGHGATLFHEKCDNKGATLVIGSVGNGRFIGGFTSVDWSGSDGYTPDPTAFLFTIRSGQTTVNTFHQTGKSPDSAVYCSPKSGPKFGRGEDMNFVMSPPVTMYGTPGTYESLGITQAVLKDLFVLQVEI